MSQPIINPLLFKEIESQMPAIVDHDLRRVDIASAVERIVARAGIQSVTVRDVGREAGFSPAIVAHYFRNKLDLMTFTYVNARQRSSARVQAAMLAGGNCTACFAECLPVDALRQVEWQVWFGYWGMAAESAVIAEERQKGVDSSQLLFEQVFNNARDRGELPERFNVVLHATRMQIFLVGVASMALQKPDDWPAAALMRALQTEIDFMVRCAAG
jgi:AcrR family transcriptional regulator